MHNQNFVYLGLIISVIGTISYLKDTLLGKIQPNKVSFALWSIAPLIAFFAEINKEVGIQSLLTLSVSVLPFIIFLASFINKKAYWKISKFDITCGLFSLLGLLLWYITKEGNWAIVFSILADVTAYLPTLKKAYRFPETESAWPWLAAALSGFFTLVTIKEWNFATYGFPLYIFISDLIVFIIVQFKVGKHHGRT